MIAIENSNDWLWSIHHTRTQTHTHRHTLYSGLFVNVLNVPLWMYIHQYIHKKFTQTYFQIKLHIMKSVLKSQSSIGSVSKAGSNSRDTVAVSKSSQNHHYTTKPSLQNRSQYIKYNRFVALEISLVWRVKCYLHRYTCAHTHIHTWTHTHTHKVFIHIKTWLICIHTGTQLYTGHCSRIHEINAWVHLNTGCHSC